MTCDVNVTYSENRHLLDDAVGAMVNMLGE